MRKVVSLVFAVAFLAAGQMKAEDKPAIVVHPFTTAAGTSWPYEMKQMTMQTVAELQNKDGKKFDISTDAPVGRSHLYTLDGEIVGWHPGNRAKRMLVGLGSGRETAKIRYWLTDEAGKRVFEHEDTIRAEFWGNAYADSVGQLAHPFADKIAERLAQAKLQ